MEKYEKPVMVLEEIEDEVCTIDSPYGVITVSGGLTPGSVVPDT